MSKIPGFTRRSFIGSAGAAAVLAAFFPRSLWAQEGPATSMQSLRRGVGLFTGRGGTIGWLISDDALVVVDTQMPGTAEICLSELGKRSTRNVDLLINSHHHGDHTGGNGIFKPKSKRILAHENVPALQKAAAERSNRLEGQVYANLTFATTWTQELDNEVVSLRYWGPAHTSGDAVIHFERANVVHMGDLVFNRMAPFIDTRGGANTGHWVTVLEKAADSFDADTQFIFGHGHETFGITGTKADLMVMRDYLSELYLYVEKGLKAGKSADELASIDSFKGFEGYAEGNMKARFQSGIKETCAQLTRTE